MPAPVMSKRRCRRCSSADLLFERDGSVQTVEIKSGATVTQDYIRAGIKSARFAGAKAHVPWLIHGGKDTCSRSSVEVIGWRDLPQVLRKAG